MRKPVLMIVAVAVLLAFFPNYASAACSHDWYPIYSEAAHPHPYFHECKLCGVKEYTGGYATKAHGDGSWGSGTCPHCGTHDYDAAGYSAVHPHPEVFECYCGDSYESTTSFAPSDYFPDCTQCAGEVDVYLNVPLYEQQENDGCGPTNMAMILGYYGIQVSESDVINRTKALLGFEYDEWGNHMYTYVYVQPLVLNKYLSEYNISISYGYKAYYEISDFQETLIDNLIQGYPLEIMISVYNSPYLPYSTSGHYITIKGISYDNNTYYTIHNDSFPNLSDEYIVPISNMEYYSEWIICVV